MFNVGQCFIPQAVGWAALRTKSHPRGAPSRTNSFKASQVGNSAACNVLSSLAHDAPAPVQSSGLQHTMPFVLPQLPAQANHIPNPDSLVPCSGRSSAVNPDSYDPNPDSYDSLLRQIFCCQSRRPRLPLHRTSHRAPRFPTRPATKQCPVPYHLKPSTTPFREHSRRPSARPHRAPGRGCP